MDINETNGQQKAGLHVGRFFISNIVLLGLVSLFIDMSTEMVYPLIPLFLASVGTSPAIVGVIEGIAESVAALIKVFSGWWGDKTGKAKGLAMVGYSSTLVYKILLLVSASWVGVLIARVSDRIGKGIRTAPRDALIAASGGDKKLGRSFGFHKMMDMLGSALGVLLAYIILRVGMSYRQAFVYSLIPAALGIAVIPLVKNVKASVKSGAALSLRGLRLPPQLKAYLCVVFLFTLGNSSNAFLLMRASGMGISADNVILLYLLYTASASIFAYPCGRLSDKVGRSRLLIPGYVTYGLVYLGFAFLSGGGAMIALFGIYGIYTALISGAERAFISEQSPAEFKGTVLGLYGTLQGVGLLFASLIAGSLWDLLGANAPFIFGGSLALLSAAAVAVIFGLRRKTAE